MSARTSVSVCALGRVGRSAKAESRFQIDRTLQELTARHVSDLESIRSQTNWPPLAYAARINSRPTVPKAQNALALTLARNGSLPLAR
jgi:hypothetical protein